MGNRRGQSTAEYALVVAVVIAALVGMSIYVKRGAMGRLKSAADQMGDQFTPLSTTAKFTEKSSATRKEVLTTQGVTTSTILGGGEKQERTDGEVRIKAKLDEETLF